MKWGLTGMMLIIHVFEEKYLNPESLKHDICILIVIQNKLRLSILSCMHIFRTFPDNLWLLQHACIIVSTKKGSCFEKCLFVVSDNFWE